jgi:hypothetical protein
VLEDRAVFANALRSGDEIRRRLFDTIEQHHAHELGNGRAGIELYQELLYALRDSGMPEVMKEFEQRFFPLLTPSAAHSNAHLHPREEMTDQDEDVTTVVHHRPLIKEFPLLSPSPPHSNADHRPRRDWGRMSMLYVAAFFGSFIILFSAFSFR